MILKSLMLGIICLASLCGGPLSLMGQSEFIDRNFGEDGTVTFANDSLEAYTLIGQDSLNNLYISHRQRDSNGYFYSLIKLDANGQIIHDGLIINERDSFSAPGIINSVLVYIRYLEGSTSIINTYDLEHNPVSRFIIPGYVYHYQFNIDNNGYLEGLHGSTVYRYQPDGFLDKSFANEGLYQLSDTDPTLSELSYVANWQRLKNNSIYLTGSTFDNIDSISHPIIIKLDANGNPDTTFGEASVLIYDENPHDSNFRYIYDYKETRDDNGLISIYEHDNLNNIKYSYSKIDESGNIQTNFGQNGILEVINEIYDSTKINDRAFLAGELSDGSLLFLNTIINENDSITSQYLNLYNAFGVNESNFGVDSKINLNTFKGQQLYSQRLLDQDLYITNYDTIHYKPYPTSIRTTSRPTATYITRLKSDKLLEFESVAAPDASDFILYPNPTSNGTTIEYSGPTLQDINLYLYNMNGELLREESMPTLYNYGQIPINAKDLPEGIYPLQIYDDGIKIWSTKFIKTK